MANKAKFFFDRLFRREQLDRETDEEIRFHIAERVEHLKAAGYSPDRALRRARLEFGGVEKYKEACRETRRLSLLHDLSADVRYGLRMLRKSPGFTAVAILTLALGVGANTAIFSLVNGVLLRPLPFHDPDRLAVVWERDQSGHPGNATFATYTDWKAMSSSFEELALYTAWQPALMSSGDPEQLSGLRVTNNYFRTLGIRPALGRDFRPEEDTPSTRNVVVLGHGLWQRRFGADPNIVGGTVTLNTVSYVVAGVLPPDFQSLMSMDPRGGTVEIFGVLGYDASLPWACRTCHHLVAIGRLRPQTSFTQANAEMDTISAALFKTYPNDYSASGVILMPLREHLTGQVSGTLYVLLGAVTFVLLVACTNVANLFLARATNRRREMAVRTALGATRGRMVRQLLVENSLAALLGGAAGLIPAYFTPHLLRTIGSGDVPRLAEVALDWRVLSFTLGLALLTGVISGTAPAFRLANHDSQGALREDARGSSDGTGGRLRGALVVSEIALSLALLLGAGLLLRSLSRVLSVSPGFDAGHVLTMQISLVGKKYNDNQNVRQFFVEGVERIRALPGVEAAGVASEIPLGGNMDRYGFHAEGKLNANPELDPSAERYCVSPGYRGAMGIPLLRGRDLAETDTTDAPPVILVNETAGRETWPGEDPLGKRVKLGGLDKPWCTVVGIVGDVRQQGLDQAPSMQFYVPHAQWPFPDNGMTFAIRTVGAPGAMAETARQTLRSLDSNQPISRVMPLENYVGLSVQGRRFSLVLVAAFAAIALLLSVVGIYGVTSYTVAARTREIGIRMALGARQSNILSLVLGQGFLLILGGIALGIAVSAALTGFLASMLFEVKPTDPATFTVVPALMAAVATVACWFPVRRAVRIDPVRALRHE
jgi:putative ABC transport system permease protein